MSKKEYLSQFQNCPKCGGKWRYYNGLLGYESERCEACGLDIADLWIDYSEGHVLKCS